ncbi:collagenase [Streptomyces sp. NPDC020096]
MTKRSAQLALIAALSAALAIPAVVPVQALNPTASRPPIPADRGANRFDQVDRVAKAPSPIAQPVPSPGGGSLIAAGRLPAALSRSSRTPALAAPAPRTSSAVSAAGVPCTLDGITHLDPQQLADFLTDPAVTSDNCLTGLIWTWDARLAPVMSPGHIQAVANRIATIAPGHDGTDSSHLYELWTYLHAVSYQAFSHPEINLSDPATLSALQNAMDAYARAPHTFDPTGNNGYTLREAFFAVDIPGLRQNQLPLIKKVLGTLAAGTPTATDPGWGAAVLGALSVNYLGVYDGNIDTAFRAAVAADSDYRAAFRQFATYSHLTGTANAWAVHDALGEYGRFGQIAALKDTVVPDLGTLLGTTVHNFGKSTQPWAAVVGWLEYYQDCARYLVCKDQIEKAVFPRTYRYDNGTIEVHTALPQKTVDQLYYASKQVKTQVFRVLGTDTPLAGDPNTTLHIHLYASRSDYEVYQPLLTGLSTSNGGIYIEDGATFYTYQRRVPQDSSLTLEELFRHEYTHYLNGRWAVPGMFGTPRWYTGDLVTAMDEGTAEFFDGSTRSEGIRVRKSLVEGIISDTAGGGPRMTVNELLHATYDSGFRFYDYAGTFFEFLWQQHPSLIREMYGYERADNPSGFDAWRTRLGADAALQKEYNAFLDRQIAQVAKLWVPTTAFTPISSLKYASAAQVRSAFAKATRLTPVCRDNGDWKNRPRFICTGRITAELTNSGNRDQVFEDVSHAVDHLILDRTTKTANNLADMNCSFGAVAIKSGSRTGTANYTCEGPLR